MYEGNNEYIFISYAHRDSNEVLPIIDALNEHGFRVWYDAGIEAGKEWPEFIEERLDQASVVLVFMTPNTIDSKNCRNEINLSLSLDKDVLVAYLEDTTLLRGMRLQLSSTQSLFRKNHATDEAFIHELLNAQILQKCRKESDREKGYVGKPRIDTNVSKFKRAINKTEKLLVELAQNGATPELLQEIVYALGNAVNCSIPSETNAIGKLYHSYVDELQDIIKYHNGDVAHHHDKLLVILNEILRYCREKG